MCAINFLDIVDIDESGYYKSASQWIHGHALERAPCVAFGDAARTHPHYSTLIAVDARVGVISDMEFNGGTTSEFFYAFVAFMLIPQLVDTGRRIVMLDRLASHYGDVLELLRNAGHIVVFRPSHSPIFGPVEWVFHYVEMFLQSHALFVTNENLKQYVKLALATVTPNDIMGYMSQAHYCVPGYEYRPYMGRGLKCMW